MQLFQLNRLMWIAGVLLLVGTIAGAGWMLNISSADEANANPEVSVPFDGKGIAALGFADVVKGIRRLFPSRLGRVVWIADEGAKLKKGETVVQIDDAQAREKLAQARVAVQVAEKKHEEAEFAVKLAENFFEEAKNYPDQHKLKIKQQAAYIDAAEVVEKSAMKDLDKVKAFIKKGTFQQHQITDPENKFKKFQALLSVEREKLNELKLIDPQLKVTRAKLDVDRKKSLEAQAKLDVELKKKMANEAQQVVDQHKVLAPRDGLALRVHARIGEVLGGNPKAPAVEFCPDLPVIVRAEVLQEWAASVRVGQECIIEDDTTSSYQWHGKVKEVSKWFTHRRNIIQEPFQFNDVRTLECIVSVQRKSTDRPIRIGQRMRVLIKQGGP